MTASSRATSPSSCAAGRRTRRLTEQFATFGIPVQPGGRTGLFDQPEGESSARRSAGSSTSNGVSSTSAGVISRTTRCSTSSRPSSRSTGQRATDSEGCCARGRRPCRGRTGRPTSSASSTSCSTCSTCGTGTSPSPCEAEPARDAGPVLGAAGRLRVGSAPRASGRRRAGRAGRRSGPGHLVLPEPRDPHRQLRPGRLRGLRRRSTTSRSTRSTSRPSTAPRGSSGRSCSCRR